MARGRRAALVRRFATLALGAAAAGAVTWAFRDVPAAIGGRPSPDHLRRSPQYRDGRFHNGTPAVMMAPGTIAKTLADMLRGTEKRTPRWPIPVLSPPAAASARGVHLTWYGHASTLVEIDGRRVLFDPVWSDRCSPSQHVGPRRLHQPPVAVDHLPRLDVIVISHDHYDHLDMATVRELTRTQEAPFVVPLGVGAHLARWRVPAERIIELDWDESHHVAGVPVSARSELASPAVAKRTKGGSASR